MAVVRNPLCPGRVKNRVRDVFIFLLLLTEAAGLQYLSGAYGGAFGAQPDEPAHYVTSLMIRDYAAAGFPEAPLSFAEKYYVHYPRVAFGLWPPLFHIVSGVWMLAFGVGRFGILSLLAVISAGLGYLLYRTARTLFSPGLAVLSALLLVSLPPTQLSAQSVMLDLMLAFWAFAAAVAFGKYLDSEDWRHSLLFGLLASAAILTKYNGLILALLPPVCLLLTNRWYLLRRRSFWLPAGIVLLLTGAWYIVSYRSVMYAADPGDQFPEIWSVGFANLRYLASMAGRVFLALALAGGVGVALRSRNTPRPRRGAEAIGVMVSALALVLCTWFFHTLLYPITEARYMLPAAPCLILLGWSGVRNFTQWLSERMGNAQVLNMGATAAVLVIYLAITFYVPVKATESYVTAAGKVLEQGLPENSVVLVCSDVNGEGMLIAEIAMREKRPHHIVARSAKLLAEQRLMQEDYRLLYQTPTELMMALDSIPVRLVVLDDCDAARCGEHSVLLSSAIKSMPERWELVDRLERPHEGPIRIYRLLGNEGKQFTKIGVSMRYSLGKTLTKGGAAAAAGSAARPGH